MSNYLIYFLSHIDDNFTRKLYISNISFYKGIIFDKIYFIGKYASRIEGDTIEGIKKSPKCEVIRLTEESSKLFLFKRNKEAKKISLKSDPYQPLYNKSIFNPIVDKEILGYDQDITKYFTVEKDSYFDKLPYRYELCTYIKPRYLNENLYIKEKMITSFSDFEEDELYYEGIDLIKAYITAGYSVGDNTQPVPGWCLTPNTPWISLILSTYRVRPNTPDLDMYEEILKMSRLRTLIFYLSVNEIIKRFPEIVEGSDDITFVSEKTKRFIERELDPLIYSGVLGEDEKLVVKLAEDVDIYDELLDELE